MEDAPEQLSGTRFFLLRFSGFSPCVGDMIGLAIEELFMLMLTSNLDTGDKRMAKLHRLPIL